MRKAKTPRRAAGRWAVVRRIFKKDTARREKAIIVVVKAVIDV